MPDKFTIRFSFGGHPTPFGKPHVVVGILLPYMIGLEVAISYEESLENKPETTLIPHENHGNYVLACWHRPSSCLVS
jgi:hypothetical protein